MNCPACGLRCVLTFNSDFFECPDHGRISGITMTMIRGLKGWEALVEIRAAQLHNLFRTWFDMACEEVNAP